MGTDETGDTGKLIGDLEDRVAALENTYDASRVECSRRCSDAYREHLKACEDVAGVTAREQCRTEARAAVIA